MKKAPPFSDEFKEMAKSILVHKHFFPICPLDGGKSREALLDAIRKNSYGPLPASLLGDTPSPLIPATRPGTSATSASADEAVAAKA